MPPQLRPRTENLAAAGPADASAAETAGQATSQPGADSQVEVIPPEANGNTGSGDGGNGTDSDAGGRQRPSRAERRINQLTGDLRKQTDLEAENTRLREMLEQRPDYSQVRIPELKEGEEITSERYKTDLISAADQIVKLRMAQIVPEQTRNLTQRQANDRAMAEIDAAVAAHPELQADSPDYDADMEQYLVDTFRAGSKGDPSYSFKALTDATFRLRKGAAKSTLTNSETTDKPADNRATGAVKSTGGPKAAATTKAEADMSASEYAKAKGLKF